MYGKLLKPFYLDFIPHISSYGDVMFNYNTLSSHQVTVEASDSGAPSLSTQVTIIIEILDIDDNLPQFEVSICYGIGIYSSNI